MVLNLVVKIQSPLLIMLCQRMTQAPLRCSGVTAYTFVLTCVLKDCVMTSLVCLAVVVRHSLVASIETEASRCCFMRGVLRFLPQVSTVCTATVFITTASGINSQSSNSSAAGAGCARREHEAPMLRNGSTTVCIQALPLPSPLPLPFRIRVLSSVLPKTTWSGSKSTCVLSNLAGLARMSARSCRTHSTKVSNVRS